MGVVLIASFAQSISGFGFALLAVPLLSLAIDTHDAVVIATFIGAFSSTTQAVVDRRNTSWDLATRLTISAYLGMPGGLVIFLIIDESFLRLVVGVVVLLATILLMRGFTLKSTRRWSDWFFGGISGVLATSTSTNGPPLVFLMQAKQMEPAHFRATISTVFSLTSVGAIILFIASGNVSVDGLKGVGVSLSVLFIGLKIGYLIRPKIDALMFRRVVFSLLVLASASAVGSAVLY